MNYSWLLGNKHNLIYTVLQDGHFEVSENVIVSKNDYYDKYIMKGILIPMFKHWTKTRFTRYICNENSKTANYSDSDWSALQLDIKFPCVAISKTPLPPPGVPAKWCFNHDAILV